MTGSSSQIMPAPDIAQRWPAGGGAARLPRGLAAALAAHVALVLLLLTAERAGPPDAAAAPPGSMIELLNPPGALPAAQAASVPAAEPTRPPAPEAAAMPIAEPATMRLPELVATRPLTPSPPRPPARPAPARTATAPPAEAPAATAPATTAPASSTADDPVASPAAAGWNELLLGWLERHRFYPEPSRRRGEQGEVMVRISVAANGQVLDQAITRSSGAPALDRAAIDLLRGASLPPPGTAENRVVRLRYRLSD